MIKITADSTCDLPSAMLKSLDITLAPLYIIAGEQSFRDGVDFTPADLFRTVEDEDIACKTAAVNIQDYQQLFAAFAPWYEAVIHICLSLDFSVCYQNAVLAAQSFSNVYVVDSRNLSTGSGYLALEAALMAADGHRAPDICNRLKESTPLIDTSFVIEQLDYLHRGGRCTGLEAVGARLLGIKPCIEVADGKMNVGKKYRGRFEDCLERYVQDRLPQDLPVDDRRVFITHTMCPEQTVAHVKEVISRRAGFQEVIESRAGCAISNHCGPNTLGIIFKRSQ